MPLTLHLLFLVPAAAAVLWCVSKGGSSATLPLLSKTWALITYVKGEGLCPGVTRENSVALDDPVGYCTEVPFLVIL